MMIKWMIPRQGWTWYNMILCNALDVDTNFNPLNLDVGYCWIIKKCFSKTPSFRPRCIKTSRSPERSVELMEMEVYSLSWKARKNWLTTWFFHTLRGWFSLKALKIFSTEAHNKVKNKIGQKYQGHSSGKSFAKELQEKNKNRKQARRYPTVAAATATVAVASFEGICHGTAKPWKMPAFSRNFWVGPTPKCNAVLAAMFWPWKNVHTQTPKNLLQII